MTLALLLLIALGFFVVEKLWPAMALPKVQNWWGRIILVNAIQLAIIFLAGQTWDKWLNRISLFHLSHHVNDFTAALIAYFISTFIYYWWHRFRHESRFFWLLCHQLHHSPRRIELLTSFYKHPVEILINSLLSSSIVYTLLGCSLTAGAYYTILIAVAEYFYHWNIKTPHWLGYLLQRPESHRVHHQYRHHTNNFADLPLWDILFGTFKNPKTPVTDIVFVIFKPCGVSSKVWLSNILANGNFVTSRNDLFSTVSNNSTFTFGPPLGLNVKKLPFSNLPSNFANSIPSSQVCQLFTSAKSFHICSFVTSFVTIE